MALTTNLVAYWGFDEGSGTTAADGVGSNDLTVASNSWDTSTQKLGAAALNMVGQSTVSSGSNMGITGTDARGMNLWVRSQATNNTAGVAGWGVDGNDQWFAVGDSSLDVIRVAYGNEVDTGFNFTEDSWDMITMSYDGTTWKTWINGNLTEHNSTITLSTSDSPFKIGHSYWSSKDFSVDNIFVWDRALTDADVTALYNGGSGITYPFDKTIEPSTLTLSTTATEPVYLIQITSGALSLAASSRPPTLEILNHVGRNPNYGTKSTKIISKIDIPAGIGDTQNLVFEDSSNVLSKNRVGLEL